MIISDKQTRQSVKQGLIDQLKKGKAFGSYEQDSINLNTVDDDQLIALNFMRKMI